ncbi:MAG: DoxX family protein [Burkholderiaceae bacterium]|nr:DoxX family protein [Burkholderiaceae bacterium]
MQNTDDLGKLLLRVSLGVLLLMHGTAKVMNGVPAGIIANVLSHGWPAWIAYGVFIGEVLAPALIILGVLTRVGGLIIAFNMAVAVYLVHMPHLTEIASTGGWRLALQGMYFSGGLCVALLGAGRFSLGGARGRFN